MSDEEKNEKESIDEKIIERGYDFEIAEGLDECELPSVRLTKRLTVGDQIWCEKNASRAFNLDKDEDPTATQIIALRLSMAAKFNGETWNVEQIMGLPADFLQLFTMKFIKYLT